MSVRRPWNLLAAIGVYALLAGWIVLAEANFGAGDFSFLIYGLANIIVFTDALDFGVRLYAHRRHTAASADRGMGFQTGCEWEARAPKWCGCG